MLAHYWGAEASSRGWFSQYAAGTPIIRPLPFNSWARLTLLPGLPSISSTSGMLSPTLTKCVAEAWKAARWAVGRWRRVARRVEERRRVNMMGLNSVCVFGGGQQDSYTQSPAYIGLTGATRALIDLACHGWCRAIHAAIVLPLIAMALPRNNTSGRGNLRSMRKALNSTRAAQRG